MWAKVRDWWWFWVDSLLQAYNNKNNKYLFVESIIYQALIYDQFNLHSKICKSCFLFTDEETNVWEIKWPSQDHPDRKWWSQVLNLHLFDVKTNTLPTTPQWKEVTFPRSQNITCTIPGSSRATYVTNPPSKKMSLGCVDCLVLILKEPVCL